MEEGGKQNGGIHTQTVDEVINKIGDSPNIPLLIFATLGMSCSLVGCLCAYMVVFTGFVPSEKFSCITDECRTLQDTYTLDSGESKCFQTLICIRYQLDVYTTPQQTSICLKLFND